MCEAFNMAILDHMEKPIISLLEGIKHYLANRIVKKRGLMQRWRGNLCPMTKDNDKYAVNLASATCACRRWDLTGIPCQHVVACIWWARRNHEDYVHPCYL